MKRLSLDDRIRRVVESGNCSGCGACCQLDGQLHMEYDASGYLRPLRVHDVQVSEARASAARDFDKVCPGVGLRATRPMSVRRHPELGPVVSVWAGHATDPDLRHRGSSGGTLTALSVWLLESGIAARVVAAGASSTDPRRTVPVSITSRADAVAAAGSRYGPVSVASSPDVRRPDSAVVGKPCEIAPIRVLSMLDETGQASAEPVVLSFFCAGTPSQTATDRLVRSLGVRDPLSVRELWYRGRGWPGRFTVVTDEGTGEMSYEESWGGRLGRSIQWRCKVCVDGMGESADIAAGDLWSVDDRGYPLFDEAQGVSAVIARTHRGHDLLISAANAGAIRLRAVELEDVLRVQPLQRLRRRSLPGRLVGALATGRRVPRYRGYRLTWMAIRRPWMQVEAARYSRWRLRHPEAARDT